MEAPFACVGIAYLVNDDYIHMLDQKMIVDDDEKIDTS